LTLFCIIILHNLPSFSNTMSLPNAQYKTVFEEG